MKKRVKYYIQIKGIIGWYTIKTYSRIDFCDKFIEDRNLHLLIDLNELRIRRGH